MKILQHSYSDGFFDVSAAHGFLPQSLPLEQLPAPYTPLQQLLDAMPVIKEDGTNGYLHYPGQIDAAVAQLPNFIEQVKQETDIHVIQALYRGYAFLTSAYTLEPAFQHFRETGKYGKANTLLPPQVAQPLVEVSNRLQVFPWLDYHYGYSLGNFKKRDPKGPLEWQNLAMCVCFSGQPDEAGFILLHVDINQFSPDLVGSVMKAFQSIENNDLSTVEEALDENLETLTNMNIRRKEMWKASRWQHYNDFRVFIMGIKGNDEIFGDGVTYSGVWDTPQQFRGQTGAQDDIIPMEDIFSGVTRFYPKNELTAYLLDLRKYRPLAVQSFFNDLEKQVQEVHSEGITGYLQAQGAVNGLSRLLGILEQIYHFRNGHWQFVQKYIMANTPYAKATGGTPITSWLPNQITAVLQQMDAVLNLLDQLSTPPDEKGAQIIANNRQALGHKKQLLAEQLSEVSRETYSADTIFSLNTKYGLSDQAQ